MNLVLQFLWHWAHLYTSTVKAQQDSCQKQKLHSGIKSTFDPDTSCKGTIGTKQSMSEQLT
jgi:hypothetical protein